MLKTKVVAIAVALVGATIAAVIMAGGASAASWHVYQGDMYAGHAYGLQVPAGAESIEFLFEGAEAGKAALSVYAPGGDKVGHYALSPGLAAASIASPEAGQYVVYVYDITDGGLSVRVSSDDKPALDLASIDLVREETTIGTFEQGKLDQVITSKLQAEPVFVTLLYSGTSRLLDATVSSASGPVVTIKGESATAFSPGVWTTLKGERTFDASMLEGNVFTTEVHAEEFEGTMVLTTLALDLAKPVPGMAPVVPPMSRTPAPDAPAARPAVEDAPGVFGLHAGSAVAFVAPVGTLQLLDPAQLEREAAEDEDGEYDYGDDCQYTHALVTLYAPDDSVLAVIELNHDTPTAQIELPVAGEYVAYTHFAEEDVILATIAGSRAAPQLRNLAIETETIEVDVESLLAESEPVTLVLEHVPVTLSLAWEGEGALAHATLENARGVVAQSDGLVVLPGSPFMFGSWADAANYAKGEHTLDVGGAYYVGTVIIESQHFVRTTTIEPEVDDHEAHEHEPTEEPPETPLTPPALVPELVGILPL